MSLRKRCVAFGDLSRAVTVLMLLLVAPLSRAQNTGGGGPLMFDVPEQSDEQGPVTVNLLTSGILRLSDTISTARVFVSGVERLENLQTDRIGQYCITIAPAEGRITKSEERSDEVFLELGVGDSPLRLIGVLDTDQDGGDAVAPDDPNCFPPEIINQPPVAKLTVSSSGLPPTQVADDGTVTVPDGDGLAGEQITLDATGSMDPDEDDVLIEFLDESGDVLNPGGETTINVNRPDGRNTITLRVSEQRKVAIPTATRTASGHGSKNRGARYQGSEGYGGYGCHEGYEGGYEGYGCHEDGPLQASITATIIVQPPPPKVVISIKPAATVPDSDALDGETVTLDGSASQVPTDREVTFEWFANPTGDSNGTPLPPPGRVITARLANGLTKVRLVITVDGDETSADADVTVLPPPQGVVADPGTYDPMGDTDGFPGEVVQLDASRSRVPDGVAATFEWFRDPVGESNGVSLGTGPKIAPRLKDGTTIVRLVVTANGQRSTADVTLSVGSPGQATQLAGLPNLTPNQRRVAVALDDVCGRLIGLTSGLNGPATSQDIMPGTSLNFTADQADLANKCRGIAINNTVDNQVEAVTDLTPDDFAVARTQALLFANTQYASVLDRLIALRGGARGLSLAGLNIQVDGNTVPLAVLQEMFGKILGGGASADADAEEPGGLLSDRWGMWMRGNFSTGGRDKSLVSPSFDVDQMGIVLGTDFRLTNNAVVGASIAYLDSNIEFNPLNEGGLDTKSMALSLYGSVYAAKSFYLDALANIAKADYNAKRNISFTQGSNLGDLDLDAKGDTDGITVSAGLSGGYEFLLFKRVTLAPNAGFFYVDATIDGFAESGASGFNLLYDEQNFKSFTGNLGFRVNSTLNLPWVVLLPGLRVDYIREFNDDVDVFQVRFAADPNGNTAPPINIQTDNPDSSYWRLSLNVSAQFKFGFAGYIEYQRIGGYTDIDFQDLAFGLRMQRSF